MASLVTKRVALYACIVLGLAGLGLLLTFSMLDTEGANQEPTQNDPVAGAPDSSSTSSESATTPPAGMRVLAMEGEVAKLLGAQGDHGPLNLGDLLEPEEGVRTGDHSRVQFTLGGRSTLELRERGELRVLPDKKDGHGRRLKLFGGRLDVDYKERGQAIVIESRDADAVAATEEGVFTVLQAGETIAVATRTGKVDLSAGGTKVAVTEGFQSIVSNGRISEPKPIPVDLLLRMVDPGCVVQRESFIVLSGRTSAGARVIAGGVLATVKPDGRFFARVPLRLGRNDIEVISEDAAGHRKTRSFSCVTVDPGAPIREVDIRWGPTKKTRSSP